MEKIDTAIVNSEVARWKENGKEVVPPNLTTGKCCQFADDNVNIKVDTLDGKGMFNATQYAAFQYVAVNQAQDPSATSKEIGKQRIFGPSLPDDLHEISSSGYNSSICPAPYSLWWTQNGTVQTEIFLEWQRLRTLHGV